MNLVVTDNFKHYMNQIEQIPLLTTEEEFSYATDYFNTKNSQSAKILIESNLRYVVKLAYNYKNYNMPKMDLIQEGNIGLMLALKKYNPYREVRFVHYASFWIKAYIQKYIMNNWSLLKIGTNAKSIKCFFNTDKQLEQLNQDDSFVYEFRERMKSDLSLNEINDLGIELLEELESNLPSQENLLIEYEHQTNLTNQVRCAINKLNERDQYILQHRILNDEKKTFKEISEELNISKERVRQLEEKILGNLKKELGEINGNS